MKFEIKDDPLGVLQSTKCVITNLKYVSINDSALDKLAKKVEQRIKAGLPDRDDEFFTVGNYQQDVQLVFLENVVNFCFWSEKGKEKWKVKFDGVEDDGASALRLVFERAIKEMVPVLDAEYLKNMTLSDVKNIFRPSNGIEIPLIEKRHENLVEAGKVLSDKFNGHFLNLIKQANFDAVEISKNTIQYFKSFDDSFGEIKLYKRAQLNAFDIAQIPNNKEITNTDSLTAMADYKLPQLLRFMGVLKYSNDLANRIDNYVLIDQNSEEEIEIRSATVWAVQKVAQKLNISAGLADRAIWWLSRELDINQLYHRSYSIYY